MVVHRAECPVCRSCWTSRDWLVSGMDVRPSNSDHPVCRIDRTRRPAYAMAYDEAAGSAQFRRFPPRRLSNGFRSDSPGEQARGRISPVNRRHSALAADTNGWRWKSLAGLLPIHCRIGAPVPHQCPISVDYGGARGAPDEHQRRSASGRARARFHDPTNRLKIRFLRSVDPGGRKRRA